MGMAAERNEKKRRHIPNWNKYWSNFTDLDLLRYKSSNLDETLELLEKEFATKLMSGEQMQLITELEDRILELERIERDKKKHIQGSLFE